MLTQDLPDSLSKNIMHITSPEKEASKKSWLAACKGSAARAGLLQGDQVAQAEVSLRTLKLVCAEQFGTWVVRHLCFHNNST